MPMNIQLQVHTAPVEETVRSAPQDTESVQDSLTSTTKDNENMKTPFDVVKYQSIDGSSDYVVIETSGCRDPDATISDADILITELVQALDNDMDSANYHSLAGVNERLYEIVQHFAGAKVGYDIIHCIAQHGGLTELDNRELVLPPNEDHPMTLVLDLDKLFVSVFNGTMKKIDDWARRKGWLDKPRSVEAQMLLFHREISEAAEALRDRNPESEKIPGFSHVEEEMADLFIRVMQTGAVEEWRLPEAIIAKMEHNEGRPYRHGNKEF